MTISGRTARTCQVAGEDFIQGKFREISELLVEIPVVVGNEQLFLKIVANYHSGPARGVGEGLVRAVIQTVLVH